MQQNNKKGLFICQLPPPVHGAAVVNQVIQNSQFINRSLQNEFINITTARDNKDVGKFSFLKVFDSLKLAAKVFLAINKKKFDFVYLTISPRGVGFYKDSLIAIALKFFNKEVIYHLHGKGIKNETNKNKFLRTYYRFIYKNVNVIHLSPLLKEDLRDVLPVLKSFHTLPNGIPVINRLSKKKPVQNTDKRTILYLSNLKDSKGAFDLLKAAVPLRENCPDFVIKYVGNWGENENWQRNFNRFITENKLTEHVLYAGPKFGVDKYEELEQAEIFVLPTKNDCFPLTILEAMQCGKAIISTYQGAIPEILSGESGVLVEESNPNNLAAALTELLFDDKKAKRLGDTAKEKFFNCYTQEKFESNFVKVLNTILK